MVQRLVGGERRAVVAAALGVSERTAGKWLARYRVEGAAGLLDRSSRPRRCPHQLRAGTIRRIERLRRRRWTSPAIAQRLGVAVSTVGLTLRRLGLSRLRTLEPRPPVIRYERAHPGELVHVDAKKLARIHRVGHRIHGDRRCKVEGAGWEHLHVCIDDATRLAYTEMLPAEDRVAATAFLQRAAAWFERLGVRIERVMTDNALNYIRSEAFAEQMAALQITHVRIPPYRPRANGKVERFNRTLAKEWAYRRLYRSNAERLQPSTDGLASTIVDGPTPRSEADRRSAGCEQR